MLIDSNVLSADFQPSEIVHRHDELEMLSQALEPVADGEVTRDTGAFIYGPTGVGKTTSARYLLDELDERADIETIIVDCWANKNSSDVYHAILAGLHGESLRTGATNSRASLIEEVQDALEKPTVVVLDECDQLNDQHALYEVYEQDRVVPICIANRKRELFMRLDRRVSSRLEDFRAVRYDAYSDAQLVAILEARARAAIGPDVISEASLEAVANYGRGNARRAIRILRHAVEDIGVEFEPEDVPSVLDTVEAALHTETVDKLTDRQTTLLETLLDDGGRLSMAELEQAVQARRGGAPTQRTLRNDMRKLIDYDLVCRYGQKRGVEYKAIDPDDVG